MAAIFARNTGLQEFVFYTVGGMGGGGEKGGGGVVMRTLTGL